MSDSFAECLSATLIRSCGGIVGNCWIPTLTYGHSSFTVPLWRLTVLCKLHSYVLPSSRQWRTSQHLMDVCVKGKLELRSSSLQSQTLLTCHASHTERRHCYLKSKTLGRQLCLALCDQATCHTGEVIHCAIEESLCGSLYNADKSNPDIHNRVAGQSHSPLVLQCLTITRWSAQHSSRFYC